jgi:aspartate/glutamate racemase
MPVFRTRKPAASYGHEVGILLIDCNTPFIPGDVGNANSFAYPVLYRLMQGVTVDRLIRQGDRGLRETIVDAARELEAHGVRAITSDCGFMIRFQADVSQAVRVPVFLSPLLQLPAILTSYARKRPVGVMTASQDNLTRDVLRLAHVDDNDPVVIYGMDAYPAFDEPVMQETGVLDSDAMEAACVDMARRMLAEHPDMAAILLECSDLPPYAKAIQDAVDLPVFDFITMVDHFVAARHRRRFHGHT